MFNALSYTASMHIKHLLYTVLVAWALLFGLQSAFSQEISTLYILEDNEEALQARVDLIRSAQESIFIEYFIVEEDEISLKGLALLLEAAERGVKVKMIIDSMFIGINKPMLYHVLSHPNIELKEYHPFKLERTHRLVLRLHDKLMVADGQHYITGGRNISDRYFGRSTDEPNYIDRDLYVKGPSAQTAHNYFLSLWHSTQLADVNGAVQKRASKENCFKKHRRLRQRKVDVEKRCLQRVDNFLKDVKTQKQILAEKLKDISYPSSQSFSWLQNPHKLPSDKVRFVHDQISGDKTRVGQELFKVVKSAKTGVLIQSPYFTLHKPLYNILKQKSDEGLALMLSTNSLSSTDSEVAQSGYDFYKYKMSTLEMAVFELQGPDSLHAKSMVTTSIDENTMSCVGVVGSYNAGPRSAKLNTELAVIVDDCAFAEDLAQKIWRVSVDRGALLDEKGQPYTGKTCMDAGFIKCTKMHLLKILLPLTMRHL